ncbi:MAG: acyl-CoA dehydrogenase family protein, partial [Rhodospirillaceae bacterium]|nr:acyl-CoA dehydrogenase family protein [Rhodospirillaceae bacterium]
LMGMAMTEKQGGSDVRANTTRAVPLGAGGSSGGGPGGGGPGGEYELTGHKWFCSAPMCDAFLTLAYTEKGLSCFFVPRFLPDGTRNRFFIQRLKDKIGNKTNASSEIEYDRTWARMVGKEGRGVSTIIEMVHHTRLECIIGSAAYMRAAFTQALHHVQGRRAFQRRLIDQPAMRALVADLAVEGEATVALMLRVARAFDEAQADPARGAFSRIATPIAKYWICKRVSQAVLESLECFGGNGFVEEGPMARLYRDSPLNGIWEGSANVICLDVLRALDREPETRDALLAELREAHGADRRYDALVASLADDLSRPGGAGEMGARHLVERMALALEASLLLRFAPPEIGDLFVATRIDRQSGLAFGALPPGTKVDPVIDRAAFAA